MSSLFAFAFLFSGLALVFFLLRSLFAEGKRQKALGYSALCLLLTIGSLTGFSLTADHEAREEGFLGSTDRRQAIEAGYQDPLAWAPVREAKLLASQEESEAPAVEATKQEEELAEVVELVAATTRELPAYFRDHGNLIAEAARMQPLTPDTLAYARFLWVVDTIESNCSFLGQRSNIEILDPSNGVKSWVSTAEMVPDHPSHNEFLEIYGQLTDAVSDLGEDIVCPAMYNLLGPNGTLMEDAMAMNDLIDPAVLHRYRIRAEDGVLWSSRDYCDRRYYLEQLDQKALHDAACEEAQAQDF